jgi:hypothetical protein
MKIGMVVLGAASLLALGGCVDDGYGYGGGVSLGYGSPGYYGDYYNDFYDGGYGTPYYGWYDGFYYPGSGYYVYDRDHRPHRWNNGQQRYWQNRGGQWRGTGRSDEWRGFQRGPRAGGSDGYRWRGNGGNGGNGGWRGNGGGRGNGSGGRNRGH